MPKRKSLTKKLRFQIFKRDLFSCQYCGQKPPGVVLEVDHMIPVSKGGENHEDNLITSCFDCNRGKSNESLDVCPESLAEKMELKKIKAEQLKAYEKMLRAERKRIKDGVDVVRAVFEEYTGRTFSKRFSRSVQSFVERLTVDDVVESMEKACYRIDDPDSALKYFCGICWNKIKGGFEDA